MGVGGSRSIVVFGASSGIGRATALAFAAAGDRVVLAARREAELIEVANEARKGGGTVETYVADVTTRDEVDRALDLATTVFGGLDVVVNAAGVNTQQRRLEMLPREEWDRLVAVNLTGAMNTLQAALARMRGNGGGLVIQVASISARFGDGSGAAYQATKAGMVALCQAAMFEERQHGIRATALLPGLTDTPMPMRRPVPPPRELLDQAMQPEDVAAACCFLANLSPRAYVPELTMLPPKLQVIGQTAI